MTSKLYCEIMHMQVLEVCIPQMNDSAWKYFCRDNGLLSCCRATLVEGTVLSLLEDKDGHIVGVEYKDKKTGDIKVSCCFLLHTFSSVKQIRHWMYC